MAQSKILTAGDMTLTLHSKVVDLENVGLGSIQAVFTGVPVGSLQLEISDDIIALGGDPNALVTNWDPYGAAAAVSAAGHYSFNISNMGYRWCRLSYTPTSGSGSLDATMEAKNV